MGVDVPATLAPTHEEARAYWQARTGEHRPPFRFIGSIAALRALPEGGVLYVLNRPALSGNARRALAARPDLQLIEVQP